VQRGGDRTDHHDHLAGIQIVFFSLSLSLSLSLSVSVSVSVCLSVCLSDDDLAGSGAASHWAVAAPQHNDLTS
jgi:hypothetical protein